MKKFLSFNLAAVFTICLVFPGLAAQQNATEEFTLEEIIVTSEKREVEIQSLPASVQVLTGAELVEQGKVTTAQMLESVPNVVYTEAGRGGHGPNSNITIRGVKRSQELGGGAPIGSSTATYVDGVYDGVGGNFDVNRIEVLRGPQGTLYGRAAAGGVIAFHTNDPRLEEFSGNVSAEYGTKNRINTQGAINVPVGDKTALRAAFHYLHQDEGYWGGPELETKEGRIKALYQPSEAFSVILSLTKTRIEQYGGGWFQTLIEPGKVNYKSIYSERSQGSPYDYEQASLEVNYDLGDSVFSYIGAIHTIDELGPGPYNVNRGRIMTSVRDGDVRETQIHEAHLASDTDGRLKWLLGASYYHYKYHMDISDTQVELPGHPDQVNTVWAPIFVQKNRGTTTEYGIFTEETLEFRDDIRITAGLRYDRNKIEEFPGFDYNTNLHPVDGAALNPPNWVSMPYVEDKPTFDNVTYKLRFEYDLAPNNMLYGTTATGYIPGASQVGILLDFEMTPEGPVPVGVDFFLHDINQQKLTSYELGSKNRFLDNHLQLNGALFFLDYEGYQEALNVTPDKPPPPNYLIVPVPVKMTGLEMDVVWLIKPTDKVTLSGGWLDAKIDGYPDIRDDIDARDLVYLKRLPGIPEVTATLGYDHTFMLGNGSTLVPRVEARYTSGYYLIQLNKIEAEGTPTANAFLQHNYQDSTVLINAGATWSSPYKNYSITAYARNVTDEEYLTTIQLPMSGVGEPDVTLGDPRVFGIMVSAKF